MATRIFSLAALSILLAASLGLAANTSERPIVGERLTLKQAVELALRYHPRRLEAESQTGAARERVGEAQSNLLPQVLAGAQYLRATDNGIGGTNYLAMPGFPRLPSTGIASGQVADTTNNYLLGVSAYQYLLDFGRTRGFIDQRRFEARAQTARLKLVELDLIFEVAQRYFMLLQAQQIVKVFEQALEQRQLHMQEAKVKANAGLKPEIDVYTAQADLQRAKVQLIDANNGVATDKVALDNAMGMGDIAPSYQLTDVLSYGPIEKPLESYLRSGFRARPDLQALENEARASGAQIVEFQSDYLPVVGATMGYSARAQGLPAANNFDVGLTITWPIFNGFLTQHQEAEARMQLDTYRHAIEDLRQQILLQVKSDYFNWQAALDRIRQAEQTLAASRAELELAEKRYQAGLGSIIELTDAQREYTQADADYVTSLYAFSIARAQTERDSASSLP